MSQYLPNLRRLDLSHSRNLEKIIDFREFLNLERLNLEGCINLVELDPSIGLLRKLVYLNLDCCYNLVSIPNSIFGLTSLEGLNMRGCVKAFNNSRHSTKLGISKSAPRVRTTSSVFRHFMLPHHLSFLAPTIHTYMFPSLRSLCCLRKVDISFCHLSQVPDTIECLHWLERLNLGGNDFVTLPSLGKLCKLEYLNLEHCKLLESLPQLPFSTAIGRDHHKNKKDWRVGLVIFNCLKLGERERCCSMTFSWMMQYIQANPPSDFAGIQIVTPGSEIPTWINNQSMGDSIQIDESPIMHDSIGFVFCSVFSVAPRYRLLGWQRAWVKVIGRRIPVIIRGSLITTKSSHVWIMYLPRESYCEFGKVHFKVCGDEHFGIEVKSCGYRWVCKQDLQEFNLTTMNHEKSFAQKCKIFAIEDETQPQPQPEQESFISQVITTSQRRKSTSDNKSTAKTISVVNRKQRYVIMLCCVRLCLSGLHFRLNFIICGVGGGIKFVFRCNFASRFRCLCFIDKNILRNNLSLKSAFMSSTEISLEPPYQPQKQKYPWRYQIHLLLMKFLVNLLQIKLEQVKAHLFCPMPIMVL